MVAVLSIVVMLGFVVPQFETLFNDMGDALPAMTKGVIAARRIHKSLGVLPLLSWWLSQGLFFNGWATSEAGKTVLDRQLLALPIAGNIAFEYEMAKFRPARLVPC